MIMYAGLSCPLFLGYNILFLKAVALYFLLKKEPWRVFYHEDSKFTSKLYWEFANSQPGDVLFSPLGVKFILAFLKLGARGETSKQISKVLSLPSDKKITESMKGLLDKFDNSFTQIKLHNALHINKDNKIDIEFKKYAKETFSMTIENIDFTDYKSAVRILEGWFENIAKTYSSPLIEDVFKEEEFSDDFKLVATSSIHFQGLWIHRFTDTGTGEFFLHGNNVILIKMMKVEIPFVLHQDFKDLDATGIQLPYKIHDNGLSSIVDRRIVDYGKLAQPLYRDFVVLERRGEYTKHAYDDVNDAFKQSLQSECRVALLTHWISLDPLASLGFQVPASLAGFYCEQISIENEYHLLILLPNKVDGLAHLEQQLIQTNLQKLRLGYKVPDLVVHIPSFSFISRNDIGKYLKAKMSILFSRNNANLSGIAPNLHLDTIKEIVTIDLGPGGTRVTVTMKAHVKYSPESMIREVKTNQSNNYNLQEFKANHPFVFMIREEETHGVIVMGRFTGEQ
uniref:Serpin domain-containing protein n=1 Tax=Timema cristinae TaxID=61476 RepID=A0A7R9GXZ4_TIMCR|nr:unnamed protein product [Timema cristinae]